MDVNHDLGFLKALESTRPKVNPVNPQPAKAAEVSAVGQSFAAVFAAVLASKDNEGQEKFKQPRPNLKPPSSIY